MKMNAIIILSLLLKLAVSIDPIPDADDKLHIYALPVGQGDCTVIQCPVADGGPVKGIVTIIDAGSSTPNRGINANGIVQFLAGTRLNFAVITHSDADHFNYMDRILDFYRQDAIVYHPCSWHSYGVHSWYARPKRVHPCYSIANCMNQVPELNLCPHVEEITLSFVASAFGGCKGNIARNEDSLIAKITYADVSTLITGDFEANQGAMTEFLSTAGPDLRSFIYKLSHHGAYNDRANRPEFLDAVDARAVFSSSGYRYGHPRCEIYNYYQRLDNNVNLHRYTCFNHINARNYSRRNLNTRKAIYVTHIRRLDNGNWIWSYYLVKFNIARNGNVKINFILMGNDDPQN